jgi:hypothetical protein
MGESITEGTVATILKQPGAAARACGDECAKRKPTTQQEEISFVSRHSLRPCLLL